MSLNSPGFGEEAGFLLCLAVSPVRPGRSWPSRGPSFLLLTSSVGKNVPGTKRWGNVGVGQHQARQPGISSCLICTFLGGEKKVPAAAVLAASLFLVCQAGLLLFAKNAGSQFRVAYREMLGIVRAKENETRFVFSS